MIYDLRLRLSTRYDAPAGAGRHIARMLPLDVPGVQRAARGRLAVRPEPDERWERLDFFGNAEVEFALRRPHRGVEVEVTARVERGRPAPPGPGTPLADLAGELAAIRDLGPLSPLHFLAPSAMVPREGAVAAWARAEGRGDDAVAVSRALSAAVHRDWRYDGEATEVDTPLLEAFAARRGVCQDFSHVLIAGLRSLGVPAGYVSGLIRTVPPPGRPRLEGADAMHAWVMAWGGARAGWIELDPTNAVEAGEDHVVVARGRDYADVVPVKGILRTAGGQAVAQAVDVIPLDEA